MFEWDHPWQCKCWSGSSTPSRQGSGRAEGEKDGPKQEATVGQSKGQANMADADPPRYGHDSQRSAVEAVKRLGEKGDGQGILPQREE